jgi:hypothetical protein
MLFVPFSTIQIFDVTKRAAVDEPGFSENNFHYDDFLKIEDDVQFVNFLYKNN